MYNQYKLVFCDFAYAYCTTTLCLSYGDVCDGDTGRCHNGGGDSEHDMVGGGGFGGHVYLRTYTHYIMDYVHSTVNATHPAAMYAYVRNVHAINIAHQMHNGAYQIFAPIRILDAWTWPQK